MRAFVRAVFVAAATAFAAPAFAAPPAPATPATSETQRRDELRAAFDAVQAAATRGPAEITLRDQAKLKIPAGMIWVPQGPADRLMRALGNGHDQYELGIVLAAGKLDWIGDVRYLPSGYVRDDEARDWNPDDLLKSLQEATLAENQDRQARGFDPLQVTGWLESPRYDTNTHRLVWSVAAQPLGRPATDDNESVNYNTRVLGREGYISITLITARSDLAQYRPVAQTLLGGFGFDPGKRYEDFNSSTDHVAEFGLAGLLGVVAAKKLGLIALLGAAFLKFGKLILIAVAGGGALIVRLFRRKPSAAA
jgi:uncharacterized membrane-anchored protein